MIEDSNQKINPISPPRVEFDGSQINQVEVQESKDDFITNY